MAVISSALRKETETVAPRQKRPPAKLWLNVGFPSVNPATNEPMFVTLPMGIPLDQIEVRDVTGNNEAWRELQTAKNELLEMLQAFVQGMEPGTEEIIDDLQVQVRRAAEATENEANPEVNPHLSALSRLSFVSGSKAA